MLVGADLGGWIAAEMMVRSTARFSRLVLVAPLGIKLRGRDERDIADFHAMTAGRISAAAWADPAKGEVDYTALPDGELAAIVRGREAFALYGWKPYMHNPRLKRWLHRIDRPTLLLWGAQDGIVTPSYGEGWRQEISGARIDVIPAAGHFPIGNSRKNSSGACRRSSTAATHSQEESRCASGISPRWPITRPGKKG